MPSVLFVCTANQYRSPLAEAIFKKALSEEKDSGTSVWEIADASDWQVGSAGTRTMPGQPVLPEVLDVAKQLGMDLSAHQSAQVNASMLSEYDLILVMQESHKQALVSAFPEARDRIYLLSNVAEYGTYDILDTFGSFTKFVGTCAQLNDLIRRGLRSICVLATALHNEREWEKE
jgi:protein-tyrosine-phosphatase